MREKAQDGWTGSAGERNVKPHHARKSHKTQIYTTVGYTVIGITGVKQIESSNQHVPPPTVLPKLQYLLMLKKILPHLNH